MNKILHILLVLLFSLTIISCGTDDGGSSASTDNSSSTTSSDDTSTSDDSTTDTTAPTVYSVYPLDNNGWVSITDNISVTFSEAMDTTSITTNTSSTSCSGAIQLSSDNFSTCIQISSSPTSSNLDKTFTVDPSDNLSYSTTYKIRVTTVVKDSSGNTLSSQYDTSSGFSTTGLYVAVGGNGIISTSSDNGTTWDTQVVSYGGSTSDWSDVIYGNDRFVAVGGSGIVYSTDGMTWTEASFSAGSGTGFQNVAFGNNVFVAVGVESSNTMRSFNSHDNGTTWSKSTTGDMTFHYQGVTYGNEKFILVGGHGDIWSSDDNGSTWDNLTSNNCCYSINRGLTDITFGENRFMAVGNYRTVISSQDNGSSWGQNIGSTYPPTLWGVGYGNGQFIGVGQSASVYNYKTGQMSSLNSIQSLRDVTYGKDLFMIVGSGNLVFTSSDNGTTWDNKSSNNSNDYLGVTYK